MPVYEYACKACGEHFEVSQSFTDAPLSTCERCGGPLRKVFPNVGVVLKGSGFYRTDSRSDGKSRTVSEKSQPKAEGTSESAGEAKGGAEAEAKPSEAKSSEAKSDPKPAAEKSAKSA